MYIIKIDYEEGKPETYKGVVVNGHFRVNNGEPDLDFQIAIRRIQRLEAEPHISFSSSCDSFVWDSTKYGWRMGEYGEEIYKLTNDELKRLHRFR